MSTPLFRRVDRSETVRSIQIRFAISTLVPIVVSAFLVLSYLIFPFGINPFSSIPFVFLIIFIYFTLIPLILGMYPFYSERALFYKNYLILIGVLFFAVTLIDTVSRLTVTYAIVGFFTTLGFPISSLLLSNLTYFITLGIGFIAYLRKFARKVKLTLPWYTIMDSRRPYGYSPNEKMQTKGFPILVKNRTGNTVVITNVRLVSLIDPPRNVPYSVIKALFRNNQSFVQSINVDDEIEMPNVIKPKEEQIVYVPWSAIKATTEKLLAKVDFHKTSVTSYFSFLDEFAAKNWDTDQFLLLKIYYSGCVDHTAEHKVLESLAESLEKAFDKLSP